MQLQVQVMSCCCSILQAGKVSNIRPGRNSELINSILSLEAWKQFVTLNYLVKTLVSLQINTHVTYVSKYSYQIKLSFVLTFMVSFLYFT